jgi:hypothetical protein
LPHQSNAAAGKQNKLISGDTIENCLKDAMKSKYKLILFVFIYETASDIRQLDDRMFVSIC